MTNARHFCTGTNRHLCETFRYQDKSALVFFSLILRAGLGEWGSLNRKSLVRRVALTDLLQRVLFHCKGSVESCLFRRIHWGFLYNEAWSLRSCITTVTISHSSITSISSTVSYPSDSSATVSDVDQDYAITDRHCSCSDILLWFSTVPDSVIVNELNNWNFIQFIHLEVYKPQPQ